MRKPTPCTVTIQEASPSFLRRLLTCMSMVRLGVGQA